MAAQLQTCTFKRGADAADKEPVTDRHPTAARLRGAGSAVVVVTLVVLLTVADLGDSTRQWLSDLGALGAAGYAMIASAVRAHRSRRGLRASWLVMTAALAACVAGEAIWAWTELIGHTEVSPLGGSDVCYLLFYPLALAALMLRPGRGAGQSMRTLLEGLIVAASCLAVSAMVVLSPALQRYDGDRGALVATVAYPLGDLLLVTVLILVTLRQPLRAGPVTLATGLLLMGVADTTFAAMSLHDITWFASTWTGPVTDIVYVVSYLLIAEGAWRERPYAPAERRQRRLASNLPLLPATAAFGIGVWLMLTDRHDTIAAVSVATVMALLIVRQVVVQRQNKRLLSEVLEQQSKLLQQANHDPLTSLANRRLFTDRVAHALALHSRNATPLTLLLIDLDDFKQINDTHGHGTGDEMLLALADRLDLSTRSSDTVARLGGDEFAVLMEGDVNPLAWADDFLHLIGEPVQCVAGDVSISASIGIAELGAGDRTAEFDELLLRADTALYRAKQAGKGQARVVDRPDRPDLSDPATRDLIPLQQVHSAPVVG